MGISEAIQLGVGVVLGLTLVAVLWYAWETRRMGQATQRLAEEAQKQRHDSLKPAVIIKTRRDGWKVDELPIIAFDERPPVSRLDAEIANMGKGPAFEVSIDPLFGPDEQGLRKMPPLEAGEFMLVYPKLPPTAPQQLTLTIKYKDVFGNSKWTKQTLRKLDIQAYRITDTQIGESGA